MVISHKLLLVLMIGLPAAGCISDIKAELPTVAEIQVPASEASPRKIDFHISMPDQPLKVVMAFGMSKCTVTLDHREFLRERLTNGLKQYYPNATFDKSGGPASGAISIAIDVQQSAVRGSCNSYKCVMGHSANARLTFPRTSGQPNNTRDVYLTADTEHYDPMSLHNCRSLPELLPETLGEIATKGPEEIKQEIESYLGG